MNRKDRPEMAGSERRRSRRRSILDTFSVFIVIPKKGMHRLGLRDVSDTGIGFDLDVEGEAAGDFPLAAGEVLTLRLYLNQSLSIPLEVRVVRIEENEKMRRVGGEFVDVKSKGYHALLSFLKMLDDVTEAGKIES